MYDHLFTVENPLAATDGKTLFDYINPDSLEIRKDCWIEPSVADAAIGSRFQFERLGYFCLDPDSKSEGLVFNRTATLRDSWLKAQQQGK